MKLPQVGLVVAALGWALCVSADSPGIRDGRFVVPHIPWAKPLAGGPIKALVVVPANGARDVWDLAECLSIEPTVFNVQDASGQFGTRNVFGTASIAYWGFQYQEQLKKVRSLFDRRYDLIILANVCLSSMPPEIAYQISEQVTAGAGLVMTNANLGDPLLEALYTKESLSADAMELLQPLPFGGLEAAVPWKEGQSSAAALTPVKPYDLRGKFKAYSVKKGRFISLQFPFEGVSLGAYAAVPSLIPGVCVNMGNRWQEDYHYATVAKACLWAAKREPFVKIASISPQGEELALGQALAISVKLANNGPVFTGSLVCELRDAVTNEVLASTPQEVKTVGPETTITVNSEAVPVAKTFIIVRLLDAKSGVVDFGCGYVRFKSETALWLKLDKESFDSPEQIKGTIELQPEAKPCAVRLEARDSQGRMWEKAIVEAKAGATPFALPSSRIPLIVNGIRAVAQRDGKPVGSADAFFTIRQPREPYYVTVSDEPWPTWHTMRRFERVYEWGGDGIRNHKPSVNEAIVTALAGCDMNPGRPHVPGPESLDPKFVSGLEETGRKNSELYRPYNQAMYNTTDDCGPNAGFVPTAFPLFVEFLKKMYPDAQALNAEWSTEYKDFADIPQDFVKESIGKARTPVWSDYLRFVSQSYLSAQAKYRGAIQSVDHAATSGCDAVYYACSLTSLYRQLGYIMPYYSPLTVEVARSLSKAKPPVYTGICTGVYAYASGTQPYCRMMPWHILLSGNNSILFWALLCGFEGDLSQGNPQLIGWMMDEISRIKLSGAAQWILSAKRAPVNVAILYSEATKRAEACGSVFSQTESAALAFQEMLEDQGMQYDYVSTESIVEDKALDAPGLKLLILPRVVAMSAAEAEAVRKFVSGGGSVWADTEPAVRDDHGKRLPQGQLDDVFGVSQVKPAAKQEVKLAFPGQEPLSASTDASLVLAGGEAMMTVDKTPLFIRGKFGKGKALLCNIDPTFYGVSIGGNKEVGSVGRSRAGASAAYAFLGERLSEVGVVPARRISLEGGLPLGLEMTEYSHGDGVLLSLEVKPVDGQKYPATIRVPLGGSYHVYELRSGKGWLASETLDLSVSPNDVYVFSLLKAAPTALQVEAPAKVAPGANVAAKARNGSSPRSTVLVFAMIDPQGVVRRDYQRRVSTESGEAACEIPLPWNADTGTWTLEVKDLLTGQAARRDVEVGGK